MKQQTISLRQIESVMAAEREKFLQSKSDTYKVFAIDRNNIVVSREFETLQDARDCAHKYWMKRFLYVEMRLHKQKQ